MDPPTISHENSSTERSYTSYLNKVDSMNPAQKHDYLRIDYKVPSQEWPDYLDYVEEWRDLYQRKLSQIRRDFIFHVLARHSQRIQCGDHYHMFTTEDTPHSEAVSIPNRDCYINEASCWYQTISKTEDDLIDQPHTLNAASLSSAQTQQFKRIVGMRMVSGTEFNTHQLLNFDQYRQQWYTSENRDAAYSILMKSGVEPIYPVIPTTTQESGYQILEEDTTVKTWFVTGHKDVIVDNDTILQDHGFHNLMRVRNDRKLILKIINKIRRTYTSKITSTMIHQAISDCPHCRTAPKWATTTYPGIFYSPPGNGKTTSMKWNMFIGIDTDWLLKHSSYDEMCQPFVKLGIPIVTNQYSLIIDTDQKMFGAFSPHHLRTRNGRPYTTIEEIQSAMLASQGDLVVMYTRGYLASNLLHVLMMQYVHDVIKQHAYSMNRVRLKQVKSHYHPLDDMHF